MAGVTPHEAPKSRTMSQSSIMRAEASLMTSSLAFLPPLRRPAVAATPSVQSNSRPMLPPAFLMQDGFDGSPRMTISRTTTSEIFFAQAFSLGLCGSRPSWAVEARWRD